MKQSIWSKISTALARINPPPTSEQLKKFAIMQSPRECYAKTKSPGNVILKWRIKNEATKQWDQHCILKNHCNDEVFVKPLYTKTRLLPGETREVVMNIYLPSEFKSEKIVLLFQFENSEGERFGEALIGIIDVDLPLEEQDESRPRKNSIKQSQQIDANILYQVAS
jgi:Ig-like domain from next to BRCA1 gene